MKLIDTDAIKYTMLYKENWMTGTGVEAQGVWKKDIDEMPAIEAEPVRHGHWINQDAIAPGFSSCSVCGVWYLTEEAFNYCPNCGAKMDKID